MPQSEANPEPPPLSLSADTPRSRTGLLHDLPHYARLYATPLDTLKRWRRTGLRAVPPDPPPFDDPVAMPAWYRRHHKWRVPDALMDAANAHQRGQPTPISEKNPPASGSASTPPPAPVAGTVDAPQKPSAPAGPIIDLTDQILEQYEEVIQVRQIVKANFALYVKALSGEPNCGNPDACQRNYQRSIDALIKVKRAVAAEKKAAGELVPIEAVKHDAAVLAERLRQLDDATHRLLDERLPGMPPEWSRKMHESLASIYTTRAALFERGVEKAIDPDFTLAAA